ncbi:hypothetical protein GCM10027187_03390 [Streptosporangium sandarakinum]
MPSGLFTVGPALPSRVRPVSGSAADSPVAKRPERRHAGNRLRLVVREIPAFRLPRSFGAMLNGWRQPRWAGACVGGLPVQRMGHRTGNDRGRVALSFNGPGRE